MGRCYSIRPQSQRLILCRFIRVHILSLLDGSPHHIPHSNVIEWARTPEVERACIQALAITGSRLMLQIFLRNESQSGCVRESRVLLWDWKTGDLVRMPPLQSRFPYLIFPGV